MRLSRILLETIIKRLQPLLDKKAVELNVDKENLASSIEYISDNPNFQQWLLSKFTADDVSRATEIKAAIEEFQRNRHKLANTNLASYSISGLLGLFNANGVLSKYPSADFRVDDPLALAGVEVFEGSGPMVAFIVSDAESLKVMGEGSKWCTRGSFHDCRAEIYIRDNGPQIIVVYNGRLIAQFSSDLEEIKNQENRSIKLSDLVKMGLSVEKLFELELGRNADTLSYAFNVFIAYGGGPDVIPHILKISDERIKAGLLFNVCKSSQKRIEAVERFIINIPEIAVKYADIVIGGRWPEMEKLNGVNKADLNEQDIDSIRWYRYTYMSDSWPEADELLRGLPGEHAYTKLFIDRRDLAKFDFLVKGRLAGYDYIAGCIMDYEAFNYSQSHPSADNVYNPRVEIIKMMGDEEPNPEWERAFLLSSVRDAVAYVKSKMEIDHDGVLYTWDMPYGSTYNGRV